MATLVDPAEYPYHLNQVVAVTTRHVVFLRRKFVSRAGHELVMHPVGACARVRHLEERPALTIASGVLLTALVAAIAYLLVTTWDRLEAGTRVPVGLLGLAGVYGVRRVLGARRHRLVFTLRDRTRLTWKSRPGDHRRKQGAADRVVEFARSRELLDDASRLVRG